MGLSFGKCFCCYCWTKRNRVNNSNKLDLNVLLLGPENVGKTEIGNILSRTTRTLYEPTNGVQCFLVNLLTHSISITEIGGNSEMQKLWHHYYMKTMGLIFCYDMSATLQEMEKSFQLLNQIASHTYMQGKPVLVVGTKSDMVSDTVQLYDIENTFALEALANRYFSSLKSTYFNPREVENLWNGINWLTSYIDSNHARLRGRINYDVLKERLQNKPHFRRKKFNLSFRRPRTAPAKINLDITTTPLEDVLPKKGEVSRNVFQVAECSTESTTDRVPTTSGNS